MPKLDKPLIGPQKRVIAHIKLPNYLPLSETFIYEPIINLGSFNHIILTNYKINIKLFPSPPIFAISDLPFFQRKIENLRLNLFGYSRYFKNIIQIEKPDILHAHFGINGGFGLKLKQKTGLPLITSFYGVDASAAVRSKRVVNIYQKLFKEGDLFLVLSEYLKKRLVALGCTPEKIIVQRIGIDTKKFKFKERKYAEKVRLLFVGRLVEKKGVPYLLQAISMISEVYPNLTLDILGDGLERESIKKLIKRLGLETQVKLHGAVNYTTVQKFMLNSDILIMPSITASNGDTEGQGAVILEAQATGMPVIGTWHNGIPEAVINKKTGLLAKPKDAMDLSQKIAYLLEHRELWKKYGKKGRQNIETNFNITIQVKKLENIYNSLI